MSDKNKSLQLGVGYIKPLIIAVTVIVIAWIIGKGALMFIPSVK